MNDKIAVAVSGGIDSLVAAYLLKQQSAEIIGLHFITGYEKSPVTTLPDDADGEKQPDGPVRLFPPPDHHPMANLSEQIGIPVFIADCRRLFQEKVIHYFKQTYFSGKTPNPCVVCNADIKFGVILETARQMGASFLATGHYARRSQEDNHRFGLKAGVDAAKDQSYFLCRLTQDQLAHACFPLGDMTKNQVRQFAGAKHLLPSARQESQDICFIGEKGYAGYLNAKATDACQPGPIVNTTGEVIGTHRGLHQYTIGQRRKINCPAERPYYVLALDVGSNRLVVGFEEDLYRTECALDDINWVAEKPDSPIEVFTRIRYRHRAAVSTLIPMDGRRALIRFKTPQPAITPGQAAVCYIGEQVVAGGWIDA